MTRAERSVLQLLEHNFPDEGTLLDDQDSFVEMQNGIVHIASTKYGDRCFRIVICPCDPTEYNTAPSIYAPSPTD